MITKVQFFNNEEINNIIINNKDKYLIRISYLKEGNFLTFTNEEPINEKTELENVNGKIDILNAQSANLLLANAKKEVEINNLNNNLANITLEVAKMKVGA